MFIMVFLRVSFEPCPTLLVGAPTSQKNENTLVTIVGVDVVVGQLTAVQRGRGTGREGHGGESQAVGGKCSRVLSFMAK
jgi:hypothetical protein